LKKDRLSTIVSLTEKFRRAFLRAYERNEVPPIDYDNILAYDWKFLIKWTTQLDMAERRTLPASRKALEETVTVSKFKHGNRPWREAFYHPQRSSFNKFQDATSEALALSVDNIADLKPSTEMIVAMSWTRSLCVTPVEAYTADAVLHRRNSLFPTRTKTEITELMIKGVDLLQRQGVISKSSSKWSNGRRWRFNTRVLDSLEKFAQQEKFTKAVEFKQELDRAFRAGEKKRVTYITNDGMIMALLNLQAHGRVRVETTGQPNVPMGHEPGNYETRKYTKKYMHFRLDIVPTESYLYDDPTTEEDTTLADLRTLIKTTPPPTRGPGGAVPVWCDVFGKVDPDRWLRYLSAVLITLASRGSMGAEELARTLKPVIMVFEVEMIVEWAGKLGLVKRQLGGLAPAVMEWWWIAVEMQKVGLREGVIGGEKEREKAGGNGGAGGSGMRMVMESGNGNGSGNRGRQRKALPSGRPVRGGEVMVFEGQ
jgi:transcription factor C subunit 3